MGLLTYLRMILPPGSVRRAFRKIENDVGVQFPEQWHRIPGDLDGIRWEVCTGYMDSLNGVDGIADGG